MGAIIALTVGQFNSGILMSSFICHCNRKAVETDAINVWGMALTF